MQQIISTYDMINERFSFQRRNIFKKINQLDFQNEIKCIMTVYMNRFDDSIVLTLVSFKHKYPISTGKFITVIF